jgi:hypothetical protein
MFVWVTAAMVLWQDTPEGIKSQYRSALKAWLEYCDFLRRIDSKASNAPWTDTKVSLTPHCMAAPRSLPQVALNQMHAVQVAGFMRWRLQQLRSEGSENLPRCSALHAMPSDGCAWSCEACRSTSSQKRASG